MIGRFTAAIVVATALAGCGGSSGYGGGNPTGPSQPSGGATVDATAQLTFSPASITVAAGRSVTFRFGSVAHNVFFGAVPGAPADIPAATANASVTRAFATAGTFPYSCHLHPGMTGTVVVQ